MNTMRSTLSSTGSTYYCHECANSHGLLNDLQLTSTNPSSYQSEKASKHSGPTSTSTGLNSVLNSGSTTEYNQLARKALQEGFVEAEANGCRSLTYKSTGYLGKKFNAGIPECELNAFRWILSSSSSLAHGYPVSSTLYSGIKCSCCGHALTS